MGTESLYLDYGIKRDFVPVDDDTCALTAMQDVQPIIDANRAAHLHGDGYSPSRDVRHVARVPLVVAEKWLNDHGVDVLDPGHADAVRKLLNSPDWRHLRTGGGVLA